MICMNYYNNKKFGLLQFYSGYGKFYFNSPKGYSQKIINTQTDIENINFCINKTFFDACYDLYSIQLYGKIKGWKNIIKLIEYQRKK